MNLEPMMRATSDELKRLRAAEDPREAADAEAMLTDVHVPALEAEDPKIAAAARATMRWILAERRSASESRRRPLPAP